MIPSEIHEDHVRGDGVVESRLRDFLSEGAVHLDVPLAEVTTESQP